MSFKTVSLKFGNSREKIVNRESWMSLLVSFMPCTYRSSSSEKVELQIPSFIFSANKNKKEN